MFEELKKLEKELKENNELIIELEGDLDADKDDEFWSSMEKGKLFVAVANHKEILEKINKIKKNKV